MSKLNWILLLLVIFSAAVLVQLWLEERNQADSIGLWYTLYSAVVYTLIVYTPIFVFVKYVLKR
jgi:hypothetical protein